MSSQETDLISTLKWTSDGLIPAIVQDAENHEVLMMAWMDVEALRQTLTTGQTHFYSRSRRASWHKGGTSGHVQYVESVQIDCDADVVLVKARQVGGACHEGYRSCFFRRLNQDGTLEIIDSTMFEKTSVYGAQPKAQGPNDRSE
ncbi:phosphoribosyl-AMP cyclohydrolase [Singulisphaera sp. Ch08]|uniref:Phosphoribosyl-AMP cyclohydrolase n=1 Tax=Singulisphaera sp. Ch08 TaxID=3120278 RepID=A0AAU7CRW2_9BACT